MSPKSRLFLGIQIVLVVCFGITIAEGQTSLRPTGLVIQKLADDRIGGTVIIVAFGSCLMASLLLAAFLHGRRRKDARSFTVAFSTATLAVSALTNVPDGFSMNGTSPTVVTYPLAFWLICLIAKLVESSLTSDGLIENSSLRSDSEPPTS